MQTPPCLQRVHTECSGSVFHPAWAGKKESASTCSGIFNRTCWLPKEPCGGIQFSSSPWAHLSALYFSFQGEFLVFPLRKKSRLSSWPWDWNLCYLVMYSPICWALQKGSCPCPGSIFLSSRIALICHTIKYKGICCNLSCQSRRGIKVISGLLWAGKLVSYKGLEKVMPSPCQMSHYCLRLQPHVVQWVPLWATPCMEAVMRVGTQRMGGLATVPWRMTKGLWMLWEEKTHFLGVRG